MFIEAIEMATAFTRPLHIISRTYQSDVIVPGAGTLFFVNSDAWAITCRHVAEFLAAPQALKDRYQQFRAELAVQPSTKSVKQHRRELEAKYGYSPQVSVEVKVALGGVGPGAFGYNVISNPNHDVALIRFSNLPGAVCSSFPVFPKDTTGLKQGMFLCRLGFPFPEFKNFSYDKTTDTIDWTTTGQAGTPSFPLEGMLTRRVVDKTGLLVGFEMSTPGLRGQSGGPVFDTQGRIWGVQSLTKHLDLDFDINQTVLRAGKPKHVSESAFLHAGECIDVNVIKDFMRSNNVHFTEA